VSPDRKPLLAVLGPTATGKSALAVAIAERLDGEIISCDSTAVYRGFDIGTDKVPQAERRGIPHHLVDIVPPDADYNAADFARDAARAVGDIHLRGRVPILVGGTGFYYRALTRGLFPGPRKDEALRNRLDRMAGRYGSERVHRLLARVDAPSAVRIQPRDRKRIVRALEVYFQTGQPLTEHFARTVPALGPEVEVMAVGLQMPMDLLAPRLARRVDQQFEAGLLDEMRRNLSAGIPATARPFTGLVYRQALDHLHGLRDEAATRALIVQENRRYARRQLIWFRKEPNLRWFQGPGEALETQARIFAWLAEQGLLYA
jgi:tRNA dimethylallyltransferase